MSGDDHHLHGLPDEAELRGLSRRLDRSADLFAGERPGLADRVFAASSPMLGSAPQPVGFVGHARRWGLAAAAAVALAATATVVLVSRPAAPAAADLRAVRAPAEIAPMGGSEALLLALIDREAALGATDGGTGFDASAIALTSGRSVDDVTVELEELLAAGAGR